MAVVDQSLGCVGVARVGVAPRVCHVRAWSRGCDLVGVACGESL